MVVLSASPMVVACTATSVTHTRPALVVNSALVLPAGTVTVRGTGSANELELVNTTTVPPAGAGEAKETTPTTVLMSGCAVLAGKTRWPIELMTPSVTANGGGGGGGGGGG